MRTIEPLIIDYEVRGFDCGYGGPLRVLAMANFLQEAAGASALVLGFGMERMRPRGQTWMLAKLDLRVDALAREGDRIRVKTWPSGLDRLLALRDITLERMDGSPLVRAVYAYLVVDIEARRPLRPERAIPELADLDVTSLGHCVSDFRFGTEEIAKEERRTSFAETASARHLDENGHVNNAYILDWLVDAVPRADRGSGRLSGLRVDFQREVLEGDVLDVGVRSAALEPLALPLRSDIRRGEEVLARAESTWVRQGQAED
jgi:acyl-CoA thioesterase FadM